VSGQHFCQWGAHRPERQPANNQKVSMGQRNSIAILAAVCTAWIGLAEAPAKAADLPVVVELFTSQGCSSCPAADKLLGELAKDPSVLPISLSVDYWDYLGWKDTLALPGHVKRQRAYAAARGDRAVYTPQVVINGTTHVLGSDRRAIEHAVKHARANVRIAVKAAVADGRVNVEIPAAKQPGQSAEVWLCPLSKAVPVEIGRGENRGQSIVYTNVVRGWIKLGEWKGEQLMLSKPVSEILAKGKFDAVAILVQAGKSDAPGIVYGAATASLQ
jgi:hypothetical protein